MSDCKIAAIISEISPSLSVEEKAKVVEQLKKAAGSIDVAAILHVLTTYVVPALEVILNILKNLPSASGDKQSLFASVRDKLKQSIQHL